MRLVVDVQPLAACRSHLLHKLSHKLLPHSLPLIFGVDGCVQEERVKASIPASMDKTDQ